jgi:glycosyltransferase involved in cell wall biosynthesis
MPAPVISIVMPFYNAAPYLAEAVQSMLDQTFSDFELILINDGSTDNSEQVIRGFNDPRIKYIRNEGNKGLVYSLNKGLDEARGVFIARMDGDDISLPERLQKQVQYLKAHPEADLLATTVQLINEKGQHTGYWKEDRDNINPAHIYEFLPVNNCIAHPSVLARAEKIKSLRYREAQGQAEDYDLWLRWIAAGKTIHKLNEELVKHRILPSSFTRKRQKNVFYKMARTKFRFVAYEISHGHLSPFIIRTLIFASTDLVKGTAKFIKQTIEKK